MRKRYPSAKLFIAGTGERNYTAYLHALCRERGVEDAVCFLGYVDDPFQLYREVDAVIVCSRFEALGRVTLEAIAAGKPVIGYNSTGTRELLVQSDPGLLFDDNAGASGLAQVMTRIIERREWARETGIRVRDTMKNTVSVERYAKMVCQIIERHCAVSVRTKAIARYTVPMGREQ